MASGGDKRGSIAGASAEQDDAGARADRPRTGMQDPCYYIFPSCMVLQIVASLPDPSALPLQPIDIVPLLPSEEDNPNDPLSPFQGYKVNSDEMGAISALTKMKYRVPVHQPQTEQSEMDQNPNQLELLALDGDHHQANALGIPKRPRSQRRISRRDQNPRQVELPASNADHHPASDADHHPSNAAGASPRASPRRLRIPRHPRSHRPRIHRNFWL